jgi:hypothetical protein
LTLDENFGVLPLVVCETGLPQFRSLAVLL